MKILNLLDAIAKEVAVICTGVVATTLARRILDDLTFDDDAEPAPSRMDLVRSYKEGLDRGYEIGYAAGHDHAAEGLGKSEISSADPGARAEAPGE